MDKEPVPPLPRVNIVLGFSSVKSLEKKSLKVLALRYDNQNGAVVH